MPCRCRAPSLRAPLLLFAILRNGLLEMPVVDRWEPVRRLRNDPHTHNMPIIGMSAHALESEREQAIATGCDEFDAKPIEFDSLVATIRRVLAHPK